ncbi:hypothetical protein NW768_003474 [Fusarium equiseti]|uniref:Uncharacterized protein n=1 Tax=Fusarium equiseti TaxID=61235 RepID=A0ABQ8RHZ2_FUSEQ|nr:hypothetical protein NW768_003474 [Fusarium equiseti]
MTKETREAEVQVPGPSAELYVSRSPQVFADRVAQGILPREVIPFLIECGVFAVEPDDLPQVFRSKRGRSLPHPTDQGCQETAIVDVSSIPRCRGRQDLAGPACETPQEIDERKRLSLVRGKLWELISRLCERFFSSRETKVSPRDAFKAIEAILKDANSHIAEAEQKSAARQHREGSWGSVLEDDDDEGVGCLFEDDNE